MRRVYNIDETNSECNGRHIVVTYREASDADAIDDAVAQRCIAAWSQDAADAVTSFIHGDVDADGLIASLTHDDISDKADEVAERVGERLERMSNHITTDGRHVFYDNSTFEHVRLDDVLENHLVRLLQEDGIEGAKDDDAFMAYCRFAERLYGNTDARIRSQLVRWLDAQGWLTFDMQGRLIGYRGVQTGEDGVAESIHRGPGYVDGERVNGHVPNPDGAVVEIDRAVVVNDPSCGCSVGLHVGTYDYASNWAMSAKSGPLLLRVAVAPEDVISVPFDCSAQKIRCCRFEVLEHEELSSELRERYELQLAYHGDDASDGDCLYDDESPETDDGGSCDCVGKHFGGVRDCHDKASAFGPSKPIDCREFVGKRVSFSYRELDGGVTFVLGTVEDVGTLDTSMRVAVDGGGYRRCYADRIVSDVSATGGGAGDDDSSDDIDKAFDRVREAVAGLADDDGTIHIPIW